MDKIIYDVITEFQGHILHDGREEWAAFLKSKRTEDLNIALDLWDTRWSGHAIKKALLRDELMRRQKPQIDLAEAAARAREALRRDPAHSKGVARDNTKVFVVHGHDKASKNEVAGFIRQAGLKPIILNEQASQGMTVIEKLEKHSDVGFAVVLLTPDDVGKSKRATRLKPRARQNVVAELFYFIALLGRERVCPLKKGDVEIPSDIGGVVYIDLDGRGAWKTALLRELKEAGYTVDWEKALG